WIGEWALSGAVLAVIGWSIVRATVDSERRARLRLLARRRSSRAELAAVEASVESPAFSPERVRADVTAILRLLESVWKSVEPHDPPDRPDW
ncbi:hypothetical protein ACSTHJ_00375, partial [Vibrio parahaemolyticus]